MFSLGLACLWRVVAGWLADSGYYCSNVVDFVSVNIFLRSLFIFHFGHGFRMIFPLNSVISAVRKRIFVLLRFKFVFF